jgi:hypothetical protein
MKSQLAHWIMQEIAGQTTPDLANIMPAALDHKMTPEEYRNRVVSFNALNKMVQCRDDVNKVLLEMVLRDSATEPGEPTTKEAEVKSVPASERTTEENEALAIALLVRHPDWTIKRIAKQVGVDRRTLYNWKTFRDTWRVAKAKDTEGMARGCKGKDGSIEAYSSTAKCASCGDLAIERFEGKDYCQTCYFEKVREDQEAEQRKGRRAKYHR